MHACCCLLCTVACMFAYKLQLSHCTITIFASISSQTVISLWNSVPSSDEYFKSVDSFKAFLTCWTQCVRYLLLHQYCLVATLSALALDRCQFLFCCYLYVHIHFLLYFYDFANKF